MIGVYFLYLNKELQYIGQSKNIEVRIKQHKFSFDMVSIINCDAADLIATEKDMIKRFDPVNNRIRYKSLDLRRRGMISIDLSDDFRKHLDKKAKEKNIKQLGKYIKAVLKKATSYKEKELV